MHEAEPKDPATGNEEPEAHEKGPRRASILGIAVVLLVVALFVFLHLSGAVGPGAH